MNIFEKVYQAIMSKANFKNAFNAILAFVFIAILICGIVKIIEMIKEKDYDIFAPLLEKYEDIDDEDYSDDEDLDTEGEEEL